MLSDHAKFLIEEQITNLNEAMDSMEYIKRECPETSIIGYEMTLTSTKLQEAIMWLKKGMYNGS
jgi:hypothetical protein